MPPTPQSADSAPTPGSEERMRRNVACVNCRNSKVRCRASQVAGEPCQRCAKLDVECVVDRSHRRITRRSKLDRLEQELQSIKQAVGPQPAAAWASVSPRAAAAAPEQPSPSSRPRPADVASKPEQLPPPPPPPPPPGRRVKTGPTTARALGGLVVSGDDIDWYFIKFFECYHPYLPVVRKKEPDECFEAQATLFWVIVCVATRRYARDAGLAAAVADHVGRDAWAMMAAPALGLEAVHALLLLCAWPLPGVRFVVDPSSTFAVVALTAAKLLGCHVGRGANPYFAVGQRQHLLAADDEASSTWLACCVLAHRSAASIGIPPPSIQLPDAGPKRALHSHRWTDLLAMYETQRFLNRFAAAVVAQLDGQGVPEAVVAAWEAEFEALRPLLVRFDTDMSRFCIVAAQLELQTHYFLPAAPAAAPPPSLARNTARALATARSLIGLARSLDARVQLLAHAPQWVLRSLVDAAALVVAVLAHPPADVVFVTAPGDAADDDDDDALVAHACAAVLRCSVRDADLPHRASVLMDTFWAVRHLVVPEPGPAPSAKPDRLAAGVTFWCLERFRRGLGAAQGSTDRVNKALELIQHHKLANVDAPPAAPAELAPSSLPNAAPDPFQEVDWSMFMNEFGWTGEDSVFLGLP